jgi:hypothetical protein
MRGYVAPVSFGAVLGLLGIVTIVGVGLAVVFHRALLIPIVIGVVLAVGIAYILLTYSPTEPGAPDAEATDAEPFDDPVEEADELESGGRVQPNAPPSDPDHPMFDTTSRPGAGATEPEPNDPAGVYDPVEEADQLDSSPPRGSPSPSSGKDPE